MAENAFYLNRSRIAIAVQMGLLSLILSFCLMVLPVWLAVLAVMLLLLSTRFHFKQPRLYYLEPYSMTEWSVGYLQHEVQRFNLQRVVDHHYYIVLYFQANHSNSCVIWRDQLSLQDWKRLKVLAKML